MPDQLRNGCLWISAADLDIELTQLIDEGRDVSPLRRKFTRLIKLGDDKLILPKNQRKAAELLDDARSLTMRRGYQFDEPSDLEAIRKLRPDGPRIFDQMPTDSRLRDRLTGAWLGRCIGCMLGKPIEGVRTPKLRSFLEMTGQWPLNDYIRFATRGKAAKAHPDLLARKWFDKLDHMPVDDDTNYTTAGVMIIEQYGPDFAPADVARFWMTNLPILATCTAERVAYRNFALQIQPPESAVHRNPYREWIGAQIRADAFGYVNMGNPQRAAELARRDASISHVKNGIYGEMLMAAMIAAAPCCDDPAEVIRVGLSEIPQTSRLHRDITDVLDWRDEGIDYDAAVERIHAKWDETSRHHWCHTNSNAAICAVGLLWGEGDFGRSICRAVQPCFDTDCNGATVGSIIGMMLGARAIPKQWTARINNTLKTSLQGHETIHIPTIARKTFSLYKAMR